jgi:hypothetical protein
MFLGISKLCGSKKFVFVWCSEKKMPKKLIKMKDLGANNSFFPREAFTFRYDEKRKKT